MILVLVFGLFGGIASFLAMMSHGWLIAVMGAPIGGSLAGLLGGLLVAVARIASRRRKQALHASQAWPLVPKDRVQST
jgi:hypothetical protein